MSGMRYASEKWSGDLLFEFLEEQRSFPPVSGSVVQEMSPSPPSGPVPSASKARRRGKRRSGNRGKIGSEVPNGKRRRSSNGDTVLNATCAIFGM